MERKILKAPKGTIYTNGEVYGTTIFLADGVNKGDFHLITMEEYENIVNKEALCEQ